MNIQSKQEIAELKPYPVGLSLEDIKRIYQPSTIRKMSDNENVYGVSLSVVEAIKNQLDSLSFYPDATTEGLNIELAKHLGLPKENFLVTNGSEELIRLIARAFIRKGDEAIMADITFPIYKSNIIIEGGLPVMVPIVDGAHDLIGMLESITEQTKMIFVCNPNNPTGTCVEPHLLREFLSKVPKHILVILDEAYDEYMEESQKVDAKDLFLEHSNLMILRTFSKIYGLASLRVGYGIIHTELIEQLVKVKEVFNVNQLAQVAAMVALQDQAFVKACSEKNAKERKYVANQLEKLNISYFPSQSNFLFLYNLRDSEELNAALLKNGIIVRFFPFAPFNGCLRATLGTREDNDAFLNVLSNFYLEKEVMANGNQTSHT